MARPRVFVSSTYYDLKHIRASLEVFIDSLGFEAILFEKGDIAFHPDTALDESCYREASSADIFVLVIGGRYGSASSSSGPKDEGFYEQYESITRKEFETAQNEDVPTFILIEASVHAEFQTYLRNKDNPKVKYAHVDSVNIFKLIESIFEKSRNNPVFNFERATEIETWLREQWSGLFRELLRTRAQQKQLANLNSQVGELKSVNETLKTYLEAVLAKVTPQDSEALIRTEQQKLAESRKSSEFAKNPLITFWTGGGLSEDEAKSLIVDPTNFAQLRDRIRRFDTKDRVRSLAGIVERSSLAQRDYNDARNVMDLEPIEFPSREEREDLRLSLDEQVNARPRKKRMVTKSPKTKEAKQNN